MTGNITKNLKVGIFAIFIASALTLHLQQQVAAHRNKVIRTNQANQANIVITMTE